MFNAYVRLCLTEFFGTTIITDSKENVVIPIIITIILSYATIRIYIVLHIYLQVSKTEALLELH